MVMRAQAMILAQTQPQDLPLALLLCFAPAQTVASRRCGGTSGRERTRACPGAASSWAS